MKSDEATLSVRLKAVSLEGRETLKQIDIDVMSGELIVLIGPNGAGKTSLLRAMAGLVDFEGNIFFRGLSLKELSRSERARLVSYLPQLTTVDWPVTVRQLVSLGRIPHGISPDRPDAESERIIVEAMKTYAVEHLAERNARGLSGGELARVLLARAFSTQSRVLLADEPLSGLDPYHQIRIVRAIRDYTDKGNIVILSAHNLDHILQYGDRFLLISDGGKHGYGSVEDLVSSGALSHVFGVDFKLVHHDQRRLLALRLKQGISER